LQIDENSPQRKPLVTSLVYIFILKNHWIKFMMISKIDLKCFQINFMLNVFMCLRSELLKLFLIFYSLGVRFFFQIFDPNFFAIFLLFKNFLEFVLFFQKTVPTRIGKLKKIEIKKMLVGGGS
jgi:hypothetical protein